MAAKGTVICHTETLLGAGGVFLGDPIQLSLPSSAASNQVGTQFDALSMISGYVNSVEAGTLDIYQGSALEVKAILAGAPAAGTSDGSLRLNTFAHPGGAAAVGTPFAVQRVAPWVRFRYTNAAPPQTTFRLHGEGLE